MLKLVAGTDLEEAVPDPTVWPGRERIDHAGAKLAAEMLLKLRTGVADEMGICPGDYCSLEHWPRKGRPFRNIVAKYLDQARLHGADAEAGFCAALSDWLATNADGLLTDPVGYIQSYSE